ncbi:hypothetical protein SLOPH_640, partial [Spraguea lophii 42_110]
VELILSLEWEDKRLIYFILENIIEDDYGYKTVLDIQRKNIDLFNYVVNIKITEFDKDVNNDNTISVSDDNSKVRKFNKDVHLNDDNTNSVSDDNSKVTDNANEINKEHSYSLVKDDNSKINDNNETDKEHLYSLIKNDNTNTIEKSSEYKNIKYSYITIKEKYNNYLSLENNILLFFRSSPSFLNNKYSENIFLKQKICPYEWFNKENKIFVYNNIYMNDYYKMYYLLYKCNDMSKEGIRYGLWIFNLFCISLPLCSEII